MNLRERLEVAVKAQKERRFDEALAAYDDVLADTANSNNWEIVRMKSGCLGDMARFEDALAVLRPAMAHEPNHPGSHTSAALLFHNMDQREKAGYHYRRALECSPTLKEGQWNYALWQIAHGDTDETNWREGWKRYEWCKGMHLRPKHHPTPEWDGKYLGKGKRLYVKWEQGLGDTIQFVRFLDRVKAASGATVILEVQPHLASLLCDYPYADEVVVWQHGLAFACKFDAHVSLMSLVDVLGLTVEDVTYPPYLSAKPLINTLLEAPQGKPNIGVCWKGSATHANDSNRSLSWEQFAIALNGIDANLWSLVPGEAPDGVLPLAGDDFTDTARTIASLDLVVTVDTSVAHLAGAMGKPVWMLTPANVDFRWFYEREDSPWYPSMRLFRQERYGDWGSALMDLNAALKPLLAPITSEIWDDSAFLKAFAPDIDTKDLSHG